MRSRISKSIVAGLTALSLAASAFAIAEPVAAQQWHGGGWHGGGWGGWHAGWGGWRAAYYRPGWGYWHPGYWSGGVWYPGFWAATAAAALATGVAVGAAASCWQSRPVYGPAGAFLGYQSVYVC
jgi:hypothetical protein